MVWLPCYRCIGVVEPPARPRRTGEGEHGATRVLHVVLRARPRQIRGAPNAAPGDQTHQHARRGLPEHAASERGRTAKHATARDAALEAQIGRR